MIRGAGLVDVELANPVDTFAGAEGEQNARKFGTYGYSIRARKPGSVVETVTRAPDPARGSENPLALNLG